MLRLFPSVTVILPEGPDPNTTEFIIPGELFPTKFRSTCHGIASASGKVGAVVGTFGFGWMVIGAKNGISTSYPLDTPRRGHRSN